MPFQHETGRAVGADRLGQSSFHSRIDGRDLKPTRAALQARNRMRRQRLVEHLHRLGPAPLGHFLREIEAGASIPDHLERYMEINPAFVRALGGDRFSPTLHAIAEGG
jgi:hypothetical protein